MNKELRTPVIAGNWKMNKTPSEAAELIKAIEPLVKDATCTVVCCTPFVDLAYALECAKGTNIHIGAENVHWADHGAFTGEISAPMLVEMGVEYVVIGHSERRAYFASRPSPLRSRSPLLASPRKSSRTSSSPMSRFGPSAPARPPQTSRPTRSTRPSVTSSKSSMMRRPVTLSSYSTAAP